MSRPRVRTGCLQESDGSASFPAPYAPGGRTRSLLVVEDEALIAYEISEYLIEAGARVLTATDLGHPSV
jgi:hypothetical protein